MFSFLLHLLSRLFSTPAFCIRTSTMIAYLLRIKKSGTHGFGFKGIKFLLYVYLLGTALRTFIFNAYLLSGGNPLDYLAIDPCLSLGVIRYHFLNQYTISIMGLMAAVATFIDYTLFFLADTRILQLAYEIAIQNVVQCEIGEIHRFTTLSLTSRRLWASVGQLYRSPSNLITFRRAHAHPFPRLSTKLRTRLVLVAILSETYVWVTNLMIRK